MALQFALSVLSFLLGKADGFLIPCPFKLLTNFDCPGCGFQRSIIALWHGRLLESWNLYPPAVPFLMSFLIGVGNAIFKLNLNVGFLKILYLTTGMTMFINYVYKIFTHQL